MTAIRLPAVDWVFIHGAAADGKPAGIGTILLHRRNGATDVTTDAEGRWTEDNGTEDVSIRGFAHLASHEETEWAHQHGVKVRAVIATRRDVVVDEDDLVTVAGIDGYLDGDYRITALHPTLVHMRILLDTPSKPIEDR